jgi:deoxyribose-phosphate aldolase
MEGTILSAAEAVEYGEFKRNRREAEIAVTLRKLTVDASRRETDKYALRRACDAAKKLNAYGVLVSPVNVAAARRRLAGSRVSVICLAGGTGETLTAVKKAEAKKVAAQGAKEIRLVLCYSALRGGNLQYLKKEIKKVRKAVRKSSFVVSLEDHALTEEDIALGVRAAEAAGADGVCVRGETQFVLRALQASAGKMRVDVSGVENSEQLRTLMKAGALFATTHFPEQICAELYRAADEESLVLTAAPVPVQELKPQAEPAS